MILHVARTREWDAHTVDNFYAPESYVLEGFVHACLEHQLAGVLTRYFQGEKDLVLLHIDENLLSSPVRMEEGFSPEKFPHIYGKVDKAAIKKIEFL